MPKNLFFTIKQEKRDNFLRAATKEFTTKPFHEVSVNTIIKEAKISRGSFYTYFNDLEELFTFIVRDVRDKRFSYAVTLLKKCNQDFFGMVKELFLYDFDQFNTSGKYSLFKNYIYYIQSTNYASIKDSMILDLVQNLKNNNQSFYNMFNITQLSITEEDFIDIVEMVVIIMINTFIKSESEQLSKEETIKLFNKRINVIEFGVKSK